MARVSAPKAIASSEETERDAVALSGGRFAMGTRDKILPQDGERPVRHVRVRPFAIDRTAVTNRRFTAFVEATGYRTEAERIGWSYVFQRFIAAPDTLGAADGAPWWRAVGGANWARPEGPTSDLEGRADHPVVHVSHTDARQFAAWAEGRLPTEAEWEFAALGGLKQARYPWGDRDPDDETFLPCNVWQGEFPNQNTDADGFAGTAPADAFKPNGFGLYNMVGNTWEWTADRFRIKSLSKTASKHPALVSREPHFVIKGGSYLCHKSYCFRYRIAARSSNTPDSTTGHIGFRLVYDCN